MRSTAPWARVWRRQWAVRALIVIALVGVSEADRRGFLLAGPRDRDRYHLVSVEVVRVIDGDTIEVNLPDYQFDSETTRVRLWGIDCPEFGGAVAARGRTGGVRAAGSHSSGVEPFALEAADRAEALIGGKPVTLRLEHGVTRGHYGRLLAHVYLADGLSLAEQLLALGLARGDDQSPHALQDRFGQLEWAARRAGVGMWRVEKK